MHIYKCTCILLHFKLPLFLHLSYSFILLLFHLSYCFHSKNSLFRFSFHLANSAEGGETVSSGSLLFANDTFSMGPPCLNWWRSQSCVHCIYSQAITLQSDNPIQTAVVSVLLMLFTFILKAALIDISKNHPCTEKTPRSTWESMEA